MQTTDSFKKFIVKELRKTDRYKLKKKEIGKISSLTFTYMETKVLRTNPNEYCEYSDFIVNINYGAATMYFRIYTDGEICVYD
ncbi:MAG: hypothetical protein K6F27_06170 [Ruminococcus sp.]|nr:hypothetical protein [Ruminococcus sp.]